MTGSWFTAVEAKFIPGRSGAVFECPAVPLHLDRLCDGSAPRPGDKESDSSVAASQTTTESGLALLVSGSAGGIEPVADILDGTQEN